MDGKAKFIIRQLAKAYLSNPQQLSNSKIEQLFEQFYSDKKNISEKTIGEKRNWLDKTYYSSDESKPMKKHLIRVISDFISSMTDDFAIAEHAKLYSTSENISSRF